MRCVVKYSKMPEYAVWRGMLARCHNPNATDYKYWGGKGVQVCERWRKDFRAFLEDVGSRPSMKHTLDRFPKKEGNYEPGNVRWATWRDQMMNRSNSLLVTYNGETHGVREWGEITGISHVTLLWRYQHGWRDEKLFSKSRIRKTKDKVYA